MAKGYVHGLGLNNTCNGWGGSRQQWLWLQGIHANCRATCMDQDYMQCLEPHAWVRTTCNTYRSTCMDQRDAYNSLGVHAWVGYMQCLGLHALDYMHRGMYNGLGLHAWGRATSVGYRHTCIRLGLHAWVRGMYNSLGLHAWDRVHAVPRATSMGQAYMHQVKATHMGTEKFHRELQLISLVGELLQRGNYYE